MQIHIRVIPRAKFNRVESIGARGNAPEKKAATQPPLQSFRVHTTTAPTDGKANQAVIALLADHFKIPKSQIKLIRGETSRDKVFEIK